MKNSFLVSLITLFLFGTAFILSQSGYDEYINKTEVVTDKTGDDITAKSLIKSDGDFGICFSSGNELLANLHVVPPLAMPDETVGDCSRCEDGSICVRGRCINLDMIERRSGENFDALCSRTRCGEGEVCVAGNCFSPSSLSMNRSVYRECSEIECPEKYVCYMGTCYLSYDENGNPVDCTNNTETIGNFTPANCKDGYSCYHGKCISSMRERAAVLESVLTCGSGLIRMPGACISVIQDNCGNCSNGEICIGGSCYGLTPQMGEPCQNKRCLEGATCVSGICMNI